MSTRSAVGTLVNGQFKGRYVHFDGYPDGVGAALRKIIDRDGVTKALRVITEENYGWSSLNGSDDQELERGYHDGRFKAVPGYGVAYTEVDGQSSPEQWIENAGEWGTEYIYVIMPSGEVVAYDDEGRSAWRSEPTLTPVTPEEEAEAIRSITKKG